ncbi:MAG: lamin tail domain-containing protein [Myxococcota bacterium]|nr:lamin tail domain-containing protein [Myxococcota bacterium]
MKNSSAVISCLIIASLTAACGDESSSDADSGARFDSGQQVSTLDSGSLQNEDSGSSISDAGEPIDAGREVDAGNTVDATIFEDASIADAEAPDLGTAVIDAGFTDSGISDAGTIILDTGLADSGAADSGTASPDSGPVDSGVPSIIQLGHVVITEFVARGSGSEWIELKNTTNQDIDLTNYYLTFQSQTGQQFEFRNGLNPSATSTTPITLTASTTKHFVVNPLDAVDIPAGVDVYGPVGACGGDCFADTGDVVSLFENADLVDVVDATIIATDADSTLTDVQIPLINGVSTQLDFNPSSTTLAQDNDDARQWCSPIWRGPTPGVSNHACDWTVISELLYDYDDISGGSDTGHEFIEIASAVGAKLNDVAVVSIQGASGNAGAILGQYDITASRMGGSGLFVIGDESAAGQTQVANANQIESLDFQNGPDAVQLIRLTTGGSAEYLDSVGYGNLTPNLVDQSRMLQAYEGSTTGDPSTRARPFSWARDEFQSDQNDNAQDFRFEPEPTPGKANQTSVLEITAVTPPSALATGSATVSISGSAFTDYMTLEIGGQVIPNSQCQDIDRNEIECLISFTSTLTSAPIDQSLSLTTRTEHGQTYNFSSGFRWSITVNETDDPLEVDYCNIQFPSTLNVAASVSSDLVFGRIFEGGITDTTSGQSSLIISELGYGPVSEDPRTSNSWKWSPASFNVEYGNDDEYQGVLLIDTPGTYNYSFRFSVDGGYRWTICDLDGAGSNPNLSFDSQQLGTVTVN